MGIWLFGFSSFSILVASESTIRLSPLATSLLVFLCVLSVGIITAHQMDRKGLCGKCFWPLLAVGSLLLLYQLQPETKPIVAEACVLALLTLILSVPTFAPEHKSVRSAIIKTLVVFFVLNLAAEMSSTAWFLVEAYSRKVSQFLGNLFDLPLRLGPTAMGLSGLAICMAYMWIRIWPLLGRLWKKGVALTLVLVSANHFGAIFLAWLAHVMTQRKAAVLSWDQIAEQGFTALDFVPILFVMECLILYVFLDRRAGPEFKQTPEPRTVKRKVLVGATAFWFLLVFVAYLTCQWPTGDYDGRVVLYQGGITSWNKPNFEQMGALNRPGLFCVLRNYLESFGFHVETTKEVSAVTLSNADAFVVMNLNEKWPKEDYTTLNDYVHQGGTLMVFADHTDMAGLMEGSNDLLSEVPIRVNFDSAHFLNNYWNDAFLTRLHPLNRKNWGKDGIGVSVGASLHLLNPGATPFLIARYGFSDKGDRANASPENYLGDRTYGIEEPLGDIVLAAEAKLGNGRVIVFGDTALLQMGSLPYCHRYVSDLFRWAVHGKTFCFPRSLVLVLFLAFSFWVAESQKYPPLLVAAVILSVTSAVMIGEWTLQLSYGDHDYTGPIAYLDHAHMSLCDHEGYAKDDGDTYLVDSLVRSGFIPMAWRSFDKKALGKSALMMSMAATKPYSQEEVDVVDAFMKDGGHVVMLSGDRCTHGTKDFLKSYGIEILTTPLGAVGPGDNSAGIWMYNANPMALDGLQETEVLCTAFEEKYPIVVERKVGKGKLTAISDYGLFFNGRLEKLDWASPANINFLRKLIEPTGNALAYAVQTSHGDQ